MTFFHFFYQFTCLFHYSLVCFFFFLNDFLFLLHFSERIGSFNVHQMWENKEMQCCVNRHFYFQLHFISLQYSIKLRSEIKILLTNWLNTHVPQGFGPKLLCVLCAYAVQVLTTFHIIAILDIAIVTFGSISDNDSIPNTAFSIYQPVLNPTISFFSPKSSVFSVMLFRYNFDTFMMETWKFFVWSYGAIYFN